MEWLKKHEKSAEYSEKCQILCLLAIEAGSLSCLKTLLKGVKKGSPILHFKESYALAVAIKMGQLPIIETVLKYVDDINCSLDEEGNTAAHVIASNGQMGLIKLLVEKGLDLLPLNKTKLTAFDFAVRNDDE